MQSGIIRTIFALLVALTVVHTNADAQTNGRVVYSLTFNGTWSADDIKPGVVYPSSAHFTELVGATHAPRLAFWQSGNVATDGVESVAELGFNSPLFSELNDARSTENIGPDIQLDSLFDLPRSTSARIEFTDERTQITLISMIAPSPDWFVGVSGLSLKPNGEWVQTLTVDLLAYDAGTEAGQAFSLSNAATNPAEPIARLLDSPFRSPQTVLGTLTFSLLTPVDSPQTSTPDPTSSFDSLGALSALHLLLSDE